MADDPTVPAAPAVAALDYAAAQAPSRRRVWLLLLLIWAVHLGVSLVIVFAAEHVWYFIESGLLLPLIFAWEQGWVGEPSRILFLLVLLPLNSAAYALVLTALAALVARAPRLLNVSAWAALGYPLVYVTLLYGQWLAAWAVLGHPPRPSLDDPKHVPVSTDLHLWTGLAMLAIPWMACVAVALNLAHAVYARPAPRRTVIRFALLCCLWAALAAVFVWDPGGVLYWWFD